MRVKLERPICFFDLETTGAKVGKDRIVEIAILKVNTDNQESHKVWRINPEMDISFQATQVHGISNDMVKNEQNFQYYSNKNHILHISYLINLFSKNQSLIKFILYWAS